MCSMNNFSVFAKSILKFLTNQTVFLSCFSCLFFLFFVFFSFDLFVKTVPCGPGDFLQRSPSEDNESSEGPWGFSYKTSEMEDSSLLVDHQKAWPYQEFTFRNS